MEVMINGTRFIAERIVSCRRHPFHKLILEARTINMETLEEAATAIGTTKSRLWELEQGDSMPRLPMLQRTLKHYGLSFDEIADID
jgi:transcriptional regulator with XRE-family HTH domain